MNNRIRARMTLGAYISFSVAIAFACFLRPSPDDFDRFVYEAIVRSAQEPLAEVYSVVKQENSRAEGSTVMDSPAHLAQLEPLYAIRPLYIRIVSVAALIVSPPKAINAVSALSLTFIALLIFWFTGRPVYSALLVMAPTIVVLGRIGGPDALSTLTTAGGCVAVLRQKMFPAILLLMISVWIRTDNVLLVLALVGWLAWGEKLEIWHAVCLGALAIGSVECINFFSGNYGWKILLHYSFVGGRYPVEITTGITFSEYVATLFRNSESLLPQLAPFVLLGMAAWKMKMLPEREILIPVLVAGIAHYMLFPSNEARYFGWACVVTGLVFIRCLPHRTMAEAPPLTRAIAA